MSFLDEATKEFVGQVLKTQVSEMIRPFREKLHTLIEADAPPNDIDQAAQFLDLFEIVADDSAQKYNHLRKTRRDNMEIAADIDKASFLIFSCVCVCVCVYFISILTCAHLVSSSYIID